ncbi:MAG TPA: ATP synthase F1 subunit delta [Bryobacteraceae bacterium]|nr:ATP synthase F1 subunit delta [Bryobacteraceae bacterium]
MPHALASRYAQALADAVLAPGNALDPEQVVRELRTVQDTVRESRDLETVLMSPAVPTARKRGVIARIAEAAPLSHVVRNFLYVIVDRRRTSMLAEIAAAFEAAVDERMGLVRAQVVSAAPLSPAQQAEMQVALTQVAGKQVRGEFTVDPALIGGVVARIGSKVYDGSVRAQLNTMRERLAH